MKASKLLLPAAIAGAMAVAAPASAQEPAAASHYYLGATFGQGHWRGMCQSDCDDTNTTGSIFAGYRINPIFSVEAGFRNYGKVSQPNASIKGKGFEIDGLAFWPVLEHLSVFGKLGIKRGVLKGDGTLIGAKETSYGPTYGVGLQLEVSRHVALRGEWQAYPGLGGSTMPKGDLNTISVGALWQF